MAIFKRRAVRHGSRRLITLTKIGESQLAGSSKLPNSGDYASLASRTCNADLVTFTSTWAEMDTTDIAPLIEQLDDNIDDLEEALDPLLKGALSITAGKLPLLDKAHLYVLVTYAIESILFCMYAVIE